MKRCRLHTMCCVSLFFFILSILGCAASPTRTDGPVPPVTKPLAEKDALSERYRFKALDYEKAGELYKAQQMWEIVSGMNPGDGEVLRSIETISAQRHAMADQHYKKGIMHFQNNAISAARKEFFLVLLYNHDHQEALDYIKNRLEGDEWSLYEVKRGDTLQKIAQKTYNDPKKDFVISYFNDLAINARLTPGMTLKLPILQLSPAKRPDSAEEPPWKPMLEEEPAPKSIDTPGLLAKAGNLLKAKKYKDVTAIVETILENDPRNAEAHNLMNAAYYQMGRISVSAKNYQEALRFFSHVDPRYKDVRESRAVVEKQLAEAHYVTGVRFYINEELEKAIKEWEATLALNPDHSKAKQDIENAQHLLRKLQELR